MRLLDKIFGKDSAPTGPRRGDSGGGDPDELAVERYRYLLRTAPPETVEQAHAEAFAKLTPDQRRQVLAELSASTPPAERSLAEDPRSLARMATRAEMREPGTMERSLRGGGGGMGLGGVLAGSLLASVAGAYIGTSIAAGFMDNGTTDGNAAGEATSDGGQGDSGADPGAGDPGMGDGGMSDGGMGDFGGGDMGI